MPDAGRELREAVRRVYAARDLDDLAPTIERFRVLTERYPDRALAWLEYGGAFDTAGLEAEAALQYEHALDLGLEGEDLRDCLLQYGSTLRNLGRVAESRSVLERGVWEFPEFAAMRVFLALTLHAAGRSDLAVAELMQTTADVATTRGQDASIARYERAIRGYAEDLVR